MRYLPPFVINGTLELTDEVAISGYAQAYQRVIEEVRDESVDLEEVEKLERINDFPAISAV